VLINEDGYISTARHVVGQKGNDVKVSLGSRNAYGVPAQISDCLWDNVRDFCVIKISPSDVKRESIKQCPKLSCNKVGKPDENVKILVKGYPQGENNDIQNIHGEAISGVGEEFAQPTTTPIARGLSGGAVVASGELVGVMIGVPDGSSQLYFMPLEQIETPSARCMQ
jgi:S1-C subfamily serine protease